MLDRVNRSADLSSIANYARSSPVRGGGGGLSAAAAYQISQLDAVRKIGALGVASSSSDLGTQLLSKRFGSSFDVKISVAARTQSTLAEFKTQLQALNQRRNPLKVQSTQPELLNATAIQGGKVSSAISIEVKQLAQSQQIQTRNFTPAELEIGTGKLVIQRASISGGGESAPVGAAVTIQITSQNNTLAGIAQAVNNSTAAVRAEVVRDRDGSRLVLSGKATGEEQGFLIRAQDEDGSDTDDAGLSALNFDPKTGSVASRRAQDARISIDAREVSNSNNEFEDQVSRLQLQLLGQGQATLTLARDADALKTNFSNLREGYNQLQASLQRAGDATTSKVRSQLSESVTHLRVGKGLAQLGDSDVGLSQDSAGQLSLNEARLSQQALAQPESLNELFNVMTEKLQAQLTSVMSLPGGVANVLRGLRESVSFNASISNLLSSTGGNLGLPLNARARAGVFQYAAIALLQ